MWIFRHFEYTGESVPGKYYSQVLIAVYSQLIITIIGRQSAQNVLRKMDKIRPKIIIENVISRFNRKWLHLCALFRVALRDSPSQLKSVLLFHLCLFVLCPFFSIQYSCVLSRFSAIRARENNNCWAMERIPHGLDTRVSCHDIKL